MTAQAKSFENGSAILNPWWANWNRIVTQAEELLKALGEEGERPPKRCVSA
jgi:hypothetical protein